MKEPNWDLYRSFLAVLGQGTLSGAARDLGLTQPTVGRHVETLEQILGLQLFTRSQQGLAPSEAALALKPYADIMAATSAAAMRVTGESRGHIGGTVRISASEVIGIEVLPPILARLQDEHPDLEIELSTTDVIEDVLNREADIAVRMAEPMQKALVSRHVGAIPLGLHAHRRYLEKHGRPESLADLAGHRLIGIDRQSAFTRMIAQRIPLIAEARFSFRADSNLAQLAAIRSAGGIGICQVPLAGTTGDIVRLLAADFELPLHTWIVMHEDLKNSPRCRVAFDSLVRGLMDYLSAAPART